jgi:hypothetical protein
MARKWLAVGNGFGKPEGIERGLTSVREEVLRSLAKRCKLTTYWKVLGVPIGAPRSNESAGKFPKRDG